MGMDCSRSIMGMSIMEAVLFVEASIPNGTPQATDIPKVKDIRTRVLKV